MCMEQEDKEDPRRDGLTWWRTTANNVTSTFIKQQRGLNIVRHEGAWWSCHGNKLFKSQTDTKHRAASLRQLSFLYKVAQGSILIFTFICVVYVSADKVDCCCYCRVRGQRTCLRKSFRKAVTWSGFRLINSGICQVIINCVWSVELRSAMAESVAAAPDTSYLLPVLCIAQNNNAHNGPITCHLHVITSRIKCDWHKFEYYRLAALT